MIKFLKYFLLIVGSIIIIFLLLGVFMPKQHYEISMEIDAPVEKTFAMFNDTSIMSKWMPSLKSIKNISGNAGEVGSKWKITFLDHGKEIEMTETITEFKTNESFSFNIQNEVMNSDNSFRFIPDGNKTRVETSCTYSGGNIFWKSLFVFINSSVKKQQTTQFEALKKMIENSP